MFNRHQNFLPEEKKDYKKPLKSLARIFVVALKSVPYIALAILIIAIVGGVVAGFGLLPHYAALKNAYAYGASGQAHMTAAENFIYSQDFKHAASELDLAEKDFTSAGAILKTLESSAFFKNVLIKNQLSVAEKILSIGGKTSSAIKTLSLVGQEVIDVLHQKNISFSNITPEQKARALALVADSTGKFEQAEAEFNAVSDQLVEINRLHPLFIFDRMINPLQEKIPKLRKAVGSLVSISKILPAFSGYPVDKTYLLAFENNRELRPAGGFIGTYGILKIKNAEIESIFIDNSYNLDQPAAAYLNVVPPKPIVEYLKQKKWFFRDSNWSPDFPTSADKMEWFYYQEGGREKLDGVIAFTPNIIEDLLGYLGSFTVDGITFTKQNFFDQLEYQVEYGYYKQGIPVSQRKDIIGDLSKLMIAKLYALPMNEWQNVIDLISKNVKEKQVLIYYNDPDFQSLAEKNDWAGNIKSFDGDYLQLVDANLAALKTDAVISRTINYNLAQNDKNEMFAQAAVVYKHSGSADWKTSKYRTYTRLYAPQGSELISVKINGQELKKEKVDVYQELGKTSFGAFFEVGFHSSTRVEWNYKLPERIVAQAKAGRYDLLVQKQAGVLSVDLNLDLKFNQDFVSKNLPDFSAGRRELKHSEELRRDGVYAVLLK
ncbi:MAG: DUF4012 domain-containing protein [Parcubacteria group bacterium]